MPLTVVFRTDANEQIGYGHAIRCLALADEFRRQGASVHLLTASFSDQLIEQFVSRGISVHQLTPSDNRESDAQETATMAKRLQADAMILDGYQFSSEYQLTLRKSELFLGCVDDYQSCPAYHTDLIINPNLSASDSQYADIAPKSTVLCGSRYAMLRYEFLSQTPLPQQRPCRNVLVAAGFTRQDAINEKLVSAIENLLGKYNLSVIHIWPGEGVTPFESHSSTPSFFDHTGYRRVPFVDRMADLLSSTHFAIVAGGSINLELCYFGVPRVCFHFAENQIAICHALQSRGCAENLGEIRATTARTIEETAARLLDDNDRLETMEKNNRELVDGLGTRRIVTEVFHRLNAVEDCA